MQLDELVKYLNDYLDVAALPDYRGAINGLQMEGPRQIEKIGVAVDACLTTITQAAENGCDLLLVHHGLFWGHTAPITGRYYRRLKALMDHQIAVYSCHLPLDVHPEVGNNSVLARQLGVDADGTFGVYEKLPIGVCGSLQIGRDALVNRVDTVLGVKSQLLATGTSTIERVGILTGGGGSHIADAHAAGCDVLITGEGNHHTFFDAEELGINVIYAGHYATETVGVKALGAHLNWEFGLEWCFIDHPTGL